MCWQSPCSSKQLFTKCQQPSYCQCFHGWVEVWCHRLWQKLVNGTCVPALQMVNSSSGKMHCLFGFTRCRQIFIGLILKHNTNRTGKRNWQLAEFSVKCAKIRQVIIEWFWLSLHWKLTVRLYCVSWFSVLVPDFQLSLYLSHMYKNIQNTS